MIFSTADIRFMKAAIALAKRGIGFVEPNPLVGAMVVKDENILSSGYHAAFGQPHAEAVALESIETPGATMYVTLEPCSHFGKHPPCADLIIKKGIRRVVVGLKDPNPLVSGRGLDKLRKHGVTVAEGCLAGIYARANRHYLTFQTRRRPYITINAGVSADGKLTDKHRKSQWITGQDMRDFSHSLRGEYSAILVGVNTILDDDPQLTVREAAWKGKRLHRVVLDSDNRLAAGHRVFAEQDDFPLMIFSDKQAADKTRKVPLHFFVNRTGAGLDLGHILKILAKQEIASVLVEGGGAVIDSFLRAALYDELVLFTANKLLGGRDSVQIFNSGLPVSDPLVLRNYEILDFAEGYILRWCRSPVCGEGS